MKKLLSIFVMMIIVPSVSFGAIVVNKQNSIKKAAPVAAQESGGVSGGLQSAASLLPAVIGLVQDVQQLKKDQQQLGADCVPSSSEISTVNDLVKEWAKIGNTTKDNAGGGSLGVPAGDRTYQGCMELQDKDGCYEVFNNKEAGGYIWEGFPKASSAKLDNGKNVSNIYAVLNRLPFGPEDYTKSELSKIKGLMEKADRCAPGTISKKKKELWGNFLVGTISKVGTSTGTAGVADVMNMAQGLGASGGSGISGVLSSFGGQALQSFDK